MKANTCIQRPIRLNKDTVILLHLFSRESEFIEMWLHDEDDYLKDDYDAHEQAAKQFIEQLGDQWCMAFMIALRDEADALIKEWEANKS